MEDRKFNKIVFTTLLTAIFIVVIIRVATMGNELEVIKRKLVSAKYVILPVDYK